MLKGIHHVAIIVTDMERSLDFYHRALGLPVLADTWRAERSSRKTDLSLPDGGQLELFTFPGSPTRPSRPEANGLRHLAFAVDCADTVRRALMARGVACEPIRLDTLTGRRFFFCSDPDDLPLEFYES
ncbi:SMU1112c/YaeR family gloxylase I-like metalloprotein [Paludibacterium paludis]|uniref:VOC family protein n=1 Tax=Paludibacterium paludis TaxID=1225769 RepID=A0A918UBM8_9NEIS|nr:VOC family protein [Paludibacterium paludis]GGY25453.1 VOC family protein [Paludibacterium paludis]